MAGGDGSLMRTVLSAKRHGVNINTLECVVIPYGTGNDFARVTGWGAKPTHKFYKSLKTLAEEICLRSTVTTFDVWNCSVKFKPGGSAWEVGKIHSH